MRGFNTGGLSYPESMPRGSSDVIGIHPMPNAAVDDPPLRARLFRFHAINTLAYPPLR
jgi:hypothetical protein